jgi:hypothetical protein
MPTSQWWTKATRRSFNGTVDIHNPIIRRLFMPYDGVIVNDNERPPLNKGGQQGG